MVMKKVLFIMAMVSLALTASAQDNEAPKSEYIPVSQYWKEHNIFQHLDLSVTAGTTGIGLEVSSPITDMFQVRLGYDFTPRIKYRIRLWAIMGGVPAGDSDKFSRMSAIMESFTGFKLDDHIDMDTRLTMNHVKLLFDVFPFKNNKHWHFTAGFYYGSNKVAIADNCTAAMKSLLTIGMYNRMYERAEKGLPLIDFFSMAMAMGMDEDEADEFISRNHLNVIPVDLYERMLAAGRLGYDLGYFTHDMVDDNGVSHKKDERYNYEPGEDGMAHVKAMANRFKPYLGFGYGGRLIKGRDDWHVSFDAGALFWGGAPALYTQDGVDLVRDVRDIFGQVGDYVSATSKLKVYPVLNLKITKRIF